MVVRPRHANSGWDDPRAILGGLGGRRATAGATGIYRSYAGLRMVEIGLSSHERDVGMSYSDDEPAFRGVFPLHDEPQPANPKRRRRNVSRYQTSAARAPPY